MVLAQQTQDLEVEVETQVVAPIVKQVELVAQELLYLGIQRLMLLVTQQLE